MKKENLLLKIADIEEKIKALPRGSITYKTIRGKKQPYFSFHRHFTPFHAGKQMVSLLPSICKLIFKYASAYLLRGARHALHDIIHLRT